MSNNQHFLLFRDSVLRFVEELQDISKEIHLLSEDEIKRVVALVACVKEGVVEVEKGFNEGS